MRANYTVEKCSIFSRQSETMLHQSKYYIAAVEMDWDFSPTRTWEENMFHGLKDRYYYTVFCRLCVQKHLCSIALFKMGQGYSIRRDYLRTSCEMTPIHHDTVCNHSFTLVILRTGLWLF